MATKRYFVANYTAYLVQLDTLVSWIGQGRSLSSSKSHLCAGQPPDFTMRDTEGDIGVHPWRQIAPTPLRQHQGPVAMEPIAPCLFLFACRSALAGHSARFIRRCCLTPSPAVPL